MFTGNTHLKLFLFIFTVQWSCGSVGYTALLSKAKCLRFCVLNFSTSSKNDTFRKVPPSFRVLDKIFPVLIYFFVSIHVIRQVMGLYYVTNSVAETSHPTPKDSLNFMVKDSIENYIFSLVQQCTFW